MSSSSCVKVGFLAGLLLVAFNCTSCYFPCIQSTFWRSCPVVSFLLSNLRTSLGYKLRFRLYLDFTLSISWGKSVIWFKSSRTATNPSCSVIVFNRLFFQGGKWSFAQSDTLVCSFLEGLFDDLWQSWAVWFSGFLPRSKIFRMIHSSLLAHYTQRRQTRSLGTKGKKHQIPNCYRCFWTSSSSFFWTELSTLSKSESCQDLQQHFSPPGRMQKSPSIVFHKNVNKIIVKYFMKK